MTPDDAAALLDRVIERAAKLRAAGVRKVDLGGASFEFSPDEGEAPAVTAGDDGEADDPSLAALIAGTGEPGVKKERPPL